MLILANIKFDVNDIFKQAIALELKNKKLLISSYPS